MTKTLATLLALAAAPLSLSTPAFAQGDPTLPSRDAAGNDILVTASRSGDGEEAADIPASITLIDAAAMEERQTRLVSDVLRDVPGLAVNRSIGGLTDVRIRGSEANHVLVLIDGIEASDPFQGQFDFGTLITDDAARIEVLRGQQSSLYGSDAIGGVIHYITATGADAPGLRLRAEGGSFGTGAGAARFAGVAGTLDYALSGTLYRTDGTPTARSGTRDVGSTGIGASAKVSWVPSDVFKLTGVGRYSYTDSLGNNSEFDGTSPLFGTIVDSPGTHFRNEAYYGLVRGDLSLADGRWNTALTAQIADTTRTGYSSFGKASGNEGRRYKASFETGYRFDTGWFVNRITGAVDYEREDFRNTTPGGFAFTGRRETENWGFVGQYEGTFDDALTLGASIRHDRNDRFADPTTYRVQAGYRLPFGLRAHGAYGTGVKNPGYYELFGFADGRYIGNPDLKPEKSKGWEAGLDQRIADGRATIGATYFDSRLEDEIFTTFDANFVSTPANRDTLSRQHGVEVFASARPIEQIRFDLAYTYLRARENGVTEVRRPRHIGSVNTTVFSRDRRLSGTLTVRYNGRQDDITFTDPTYATSPIVSLQEYVLVNLNAEYRLTEAISVFGRIENLIDEEYEEVFSFATPGRSVIGGVKARF